MTYLERVTPKVKLNLKLQCYSQVYVIIVMTILIIEKKIFGC